MTPVVGVLALQGAFAKHIDACTSVGLAAIEVRSAAQLDTVDAVIVPGGESTTISMMLDRNELREPLAARLAENTPVFGTCAGMILLATEIADGRDDQLPLGAIDISVRRNGYGRQNQSFSDEIAIEGWADPLHAVFIRAPRVERVGEGVEVMASYGPDPVLCRSGSVLVAAFHPELSTDGRLHRYFGDLI